MSRANVSACKRMPHTLRSSGLNLILILSLAVIQASGLNFISMYQPTHFSSKFIFFTPKYIAERVKWRECQYRGKRRDASDILRPGYTSID